MSKMIKLIIDTNSYSGNFEREMCAYVTGQYGECGVGKDLAISSVKDIKYIDWWNKNILQKSPPKPELKVYRPVSIYQDKQGEYNSLVIYAKKKPSEIVILEFICRVKEFCKKKEINVYGVRILEGSEEKLIEEINFWLKIKYGRARSHLKK